MTDFITAFSLIAIAELGDRTQMLALAFSSKYKVRTILTGVTLGIFLNHGIAILLASVLAQFLSASYIRIFSSCLFLIFGLLSLKLNIEDDDSFHDEKERISPIFTISSAFFLGELGDKSQLTAMALGGQSSLPLFVLLGTTCAMVIVSSIGIIVGKILGKKLPQVTLQFLSAIIFLFFGVQGLYQNLPWSWKTPWTITVFILFLSAVIFWLLKSNYIRRERALALHLSKLLSSCKECENHRHDCPISIAIHQTTKKYLGQELPYVGRVILFLESMSIHSPKKSSHIQKPFDKA